MTNKRRRMFSLLLVVFALLSMLGAAAIFNQRSLRLRGALDGVPSRELPARVPVLGVNVDLAQYDEDSLSENLDMIAESGFIWIRQPIYRADMTSTAPPDYAHIFQQARQRNLRVVAVLLDDRDASSPPPDLTAWAAFVEQVAEDYGSLVDVYQIWDEPNLSTGWGAPPSAVDYAALLEASYTTLQRADDDPFVLTAGLAPTIETGPENISDVLFLRALYENGAAPFFDAVAGKPYGFDSGPDDRRVHENLLNFSRMVRLREEMVVHDDAGKPLWASHFGWNALPADWEGEPSLWGQTTLDQQADNTIDAYQRALTEWPWAGVLILENWQPNGPPDDPRWGFALRRQDGTLTPAAEAIRANAERFTSVMWPGVYPAATLLVDYRGEWKFSELGADFSEDNDSEVFIPFIGDTLAVTVRRDQYRAYLYVTVDEQPPDILPQDERGAYLVLTSPDYSPRIETLPVATGLNPDRQHMAHLQAERGWDQWALVGYAVGHNIPTIGYDVAITALLILALGAIAGALYLGRGLKWQTGLSNLAAWLTGRLGDALHFSLSLAVSLAVWLGAALTWGGLVPSLVRRLGDGPSLLITALTAGVFYFSPWLVLTLIALLALFVLIYARPSIGLALMIFFTPYYLLPRPLFDRMFSMVEVLSLLTLAAWVVRIVAERREKGWPTLRTLWQALTPLDKAISLFVAVCAASLVWSDLLGVAATELRQMVLEPLVVYLVLRTMPFTSRERWRVVDMLVLTAVIVSLIGFYQMITGIDVITAEQGARRLQSISGTPNNAALFLDRVLPIAAAVAVIGGSKRRRWLYGVSGIIILIAAGLTLSKGAILLGIPAGLGLVIILWLGKTGVFMVIGGIIAEGLALIPLSRHPRFAETFDFASETSTSLFRIRLWRSTLRMIRDHPFTGVGLDQFLYEYRGRYILPAAWRQPDLSQPHNVFLNYWARLGIVGLAAGLWLQVAFWRTAWRTQKALRGVSTGWRALAVGLMGSMGAMIAHGMVDAVHFVIDLAFIFFMTLGLMHQLNEEGQVYGNRNQQPDVKTG